ncbi:hypothetical protein A0H81_05091 [Grifola frondosa]|uniref:Uncharacterized protein n=1 Tax=Grifola frondosa TaxID=5627 RepID=A0A1C7MDA1_GRIFR|nr:hypothetical protein A0H81_05091 [Grifola frondosa]
MAPVLSPKLDDQAYPDGRRTGTKGSHREIRPTSGRVPITYRVSSGQLRVSRRIQFRSPIRRTFETCSR